MDQDLIKLVNRLQDTFHNLGEKFPISDSFQTNVIAKGGELDMPQLVVVCHCVIHWYSELSYWQGWQSVGRQI